ncbi:MAG: hypothetical protein JWQ72_3135 [Polaromonas sp.]|nr:hypothetical protein [Polaromonas sp.]
MTPAIRHGQGPHKAVVMNGWLGCAAHWQGMLEAVDPAAGDIAVFDYRGYGTRRGEAGEYTFDEVARDVLELADSLGWERFSLIGQSMGGMAMQRVALAAPGRIISLLGLAPVSAAGSGLAGDRLALFEQALFDEAACQRIVDFSTGKRLSPTWCAGIARAARASHAPQAMRSYLLQWGQGNFAEQASGLRLPVRVMVGQHDPSINLVSVNANWRLHHPQAEVEGIAGVGHYPMQEAPAYTGSAVERWLTRPMAAPG